MCCTPMPKVHAQPANGHSGPDQQAPTSPGLRCRHAIEVRNTQPGLGQGLPISGSSLRTWSRLASSGTTPPYSACSAIWLYTACARRPAAPPTAVS